MKYLLTTIFIIFSLLNFSQPWLNNVIKHKTLNELTLQDHLEAFNQYWADKNVQNGKYTENGVEKKAYGWKQFLRWYNHWESRVEFGTKKFPSAQAYNIAIQQYQQSLQTKSTNGQWTSLGPSSSNGGYAGVGRISCVSFHPTDANTYWIGSPAGGLWVTSNDGSTWSVLTDQLDVIGVSAIAIPSDYSSSHTIYIGTRDRDARDNNSNGVLKSTDGGITWSSTGLSFNPSDGNQLTKILIDPTNNNHLFASAYTGIYETTNAGISWNQISSISYVIDMEFKSDNPNIIFASTLFSGEIYRLNRSSSTENLVYNYNSGMRVELAVTDANSNIVYAVIADDDNGLYEIAKSSNGGLSFNTVYAGPNILGWDASGGDSGGQGWYDLSLAVDPTDEDVVFCGGVNTWASFDGGVSWNIANHWWGDGVDAVHADKHYLAYNPTNGYLFECNDGGLYKTSDGFSWDNISNGIINSQMYKLSVSQTESNSTITGLQDNGTKLLYTDGNWYDVKGGDGMECLIDYSDYNVQYGTYVYGQITRTIDGWSGDYTDIEPSGAGDGAWVTPYIIHPSTPTTLYAGYSDVWKTTNRGNSWTQISNINSSDKIRSMAISASNPQVLYVADRTHIWKTTNEGTSWTDVTNNLPSSSITYIAIKNDDPNTVWVTLGSYNADAIYLSTNGGSSWSNISTGIPNIPTNCIIQNTQNTGETELYAGTDFGVYLKRGNNNWELFNTGMPKVVVGELDIYYDANPNNSKLRAATYGRGLWESDLYSAASTTPPVADFSADQTSICSGENINFTDLSSNTPTSWTWSITPSTGVTYTGGTDANSQNPVITFAQAGTYTVALSATNGAGFDNETKVDFITVNASPAVDFSADQTSISFGETIGFTDLSSESPSSWEWVFSNGNPAISYSQNPMVTYNIPGTFDVTLTATLNGCSNSLTKVDYITVSNQIVSCLGNFYDSGGENGNYANLEDLSWLIQSDIGENLYMTFDTIRLESGYDYLYIYDGIDDSAPLTGTYSGNYGPFTINSTNSSNYLYIKFHSDASVTDLGWDAHYFCNDFILSPEAEFSANETTICSGENINFTDLSSNTPTSWTWSITPSTGVTYTGGTDANSQNPIITFTQAGTYTVALTATNEGGFDTETKTNYITVIGTPESPDAIVGNTDVCQLTQQNFSTNYISGYTYNWTFPTDWSGGSTTNSIDLTIGAESGTVSVTASNTCGMSPAQILEISVIESPNNLTSISGNETLCSNSQSTYSVSAINNAVYYWTLPNGWTGSSSTNNISVTANDQSGTISVYAENSCGTSSTENINIDVVAGTPSQPSPIIGANPVCINAITNYSVNNISGITYFWSLPSGWSGSGHTSGIDVNVGNTGGVITVTPFNACGMGISRTLNVSVNQAITSVSSINGLSEVCENQSLTYQVTAQNATQFVWALPSGWTGNSTTNNIHPTAGTNSGNIEVTPTNACGNGPAASISVVVNMLPTAYFSHSNQGLVVDFIDNSNLANTYNWNFGDGTTSSEQNPTHNYTNSGTYTATLTVSNDCGSDTYYTTINVTNVGINIQANEDWKIYPNPTQSYLNIEGLSLHKKYTVKITDVSGRIVLINEDLLKTNVLSFDLNHLINGSYFIEIQQDNTIKQYKFVKN